VEPGARTDLGARDLGPAARIPGRVVDENGAAVRVNVKLVAVDGRAPDRALPLVEMVSTDEQGRFTVESAGRRRYLLSIEGHDWAAPVQSVDARSGIQEEIVVHAAQVGELKQTFPIEPPPGSVYVVESDALGGLPVAVEPADGWRSLS